MTKIKIEVSARHCHLNQQAVNVLFGNNYQFKVLKMVSQPGQFATAEEVIVKGPKGEQKMRIVGPIRQDNQVELATTDCYKLGIQPVLRVSGQIKGTPGAVLIGPKGKLAIKEGVIVAQRHVHLAIKEAARLRLKNGQMVKVRVGGARGLVFEQVVVRSGVGHKKSFQIDTDEGNACGWEIGLKGELSK